MRGGGLENSATRGDEHPRLGVDFEGDDGGGAAGRRADGPAAGRPGGPAAGRPGGRLYRFIKLCSISGRLAGRRPGQRPAGLPAGLAYHVCLGGGLPLRMPVQGLFKFFGVAA